mmetsp:Transcript_148411/g.476632  ORF Transcript_148411/g.476632 Transcript_148411/m.476632 type:complete len:234 (+) Transcript_148411:3-704(+)
MYGGAEWNIHCSRGRGTLGRRLITRALPGRKQRVDALLQALQALGCHRRQRHQRHGVGGVRHRRRCRRGRRHGDTGEALAEADDVAEEAHRRALQVRAAVHQRRQRAHGAGHDLHARQRGPIHHGHGSVLGHAHCDQLLTDAGQRAEAHVQGIGRRRREELLPVKVVILGGRRVHRQYPQRRRQLPERQRHPRVRARGKRRGDRRHDLIGHSGPGELFHLLAHSPVDHRISAL